MLGLYYRIWVDLIARARSPKARTKNWRSLSMLLMTVSMSLNLMLVMTILQEYIIGTYFYQIELSQLPLYWNNALACLLLYFGPCALLNYLFIFHGRRYSRLMQRYPHRKGKLFLNYFLISLGLPQVLIWAEIIWSRWSS